MPNTQDIVPGSLIQAAVFGGSGVGKTHFALTFPRPNVIDLDKGILTSRSQHFVSRYGNKPILYEQFKERSLNSRGIVLTHNAFDDACRYFDEWMKPVKRDLFDTWVVDSGTSLCEFAMNKAAILLGSNAFGRSPLSQTQSQALATGLLFPKIQDYGAERSMTEQFIRMVRDAGKHFVFILHEKETRDKEGQLLEIKPALTGQSADVVPAMFDNVWSMRVIGAGSSMRRVLATEPDGLRKAKSRLGMGELSNPDYDLVAQKMLDLIKTQGGITPSGGSSAPSVPAIQGASV